MRNTVLDEAQAGIKIVGRNIIWINSLEFDMEVSIFSTFPTQKMKASKYHVLWPKNYHILNHRAHQIFGP